MKQKAIYIAFCLIFSFILTTKNASATYDPLSVNNNYIGIHILSPDELPQAARLVNSSGGDWGYVTIPIQANDLSLDKWQKFMDSCSEYHLIPILRLATEAYYKETNVWRIPTQFDVLDFANFLNSLTWPTKNRYVILFNEVNRYDEWEGNPPDPAAYADLVDYASEVFKRRSDEFFIILGAMDNAAPNDRIRYMDNFVYLRQMQFHNPHVFGKIDGFASHSYPNPNFTQPPLSTLMSVGTYKYEANIINGNSGQRKGVFITETGWNGDVLSGDTIASYFTYSLKNIWKQNDDNIVAITPFLLNAGGPFGKFSFLRNNQETPYFHALEAYSKIKGTPQIVERSVPLPLTQQMILGVKDFEKQKPVSSESNFTKYKNQMSPILKGIFKAMLGL